VFALPILISGIVLSSIWHIHLLKMPATKADLVAICEATRATLAGGNPYSEATTAQIQRAYYGRPLRPSDGVNKMTFAYPAHTIVLFSVLTPFSWPAIRLAFLVLLPLLTAVSVFLWLRVTQIHLQPGQLALVVVLAVGSMPVIWGIHLIQPSLVVAALVTAGCFLAQRGSAAAAGMLLAMATIKPQLVAPLIAWLLLWTLLRRQWSFIVTFAGSLCALLTCATWIAPGWFGSWRVAVIDFVAYRHLKLDLQNFFGHWLGLLLTTACASVAGLALWRCRRCSAASPCFGAMCALALATALCMQPSDLSMLYNHVLLIPACLILVFRRPENAFAYRVSRLAIAQLVIDFVAVPVAVLGETVTGESKFWTVLPYMDYLLPSLLALMLASEALRSSTSAVVPRPRLAVEFAHS
jgi:hypothetical protein